MMDFQVLAVAPIGTSERDVPRLLRFLCEVFYLKQIPEEGAFKVGGACFVHPVAHRGAGRRHAAADAGG